MNAAILSGVVRKRRAEIIPATGRLFARLVIENEDGVFVVVGYGPTALRLAAAPEGRQVVVQGRLRQRRPNGRTLWEIVVEDPGGLAVIGGGE
jgi:hypothetical protein